MARLARQARGLSQTELASRMQIGQGTVSRFETSQSGIGEELIDNLSEALKVSTRLFEMDWSPIGLGLHEFHHRKRRRASAKALLQIHATITIQWHQLNLLQEGGLDEAARFPYLPISGHYPTPAAVADEIRAHWNLPPGPVDNLVHAVERGGGLVILCDFGTSDVDGLSVWLHPSPPVFWLNRLIPPDRARWTLAHELGHVVMHTGEFGNPEIEREADQFAAQFLLPDHSIRNELVGLTPMQLPGLKREWRVSMQALIMRARDLGLISNRKKQRLFMELSRAGYRLREPRELDPMPEQPTGVQRMLERFARNLNWSPVELRNWLGACGDDLQKLASDFTPQLRVVNSEQSQNTSQRSIQL
ncbi:MAG: XRE family transcriptional regulator [Chloroflexota bacterium]|nr:XRE family transcriptional regulator [Chloroflexota bacterium]